MIDLRKHILYCTLEWNEIIDEMLHAYLGKGKVVVIIQSQIKVNDKLGYEKTFDFSFKLPAKSNYNL